MKLKTKFQDEDFDLGEVVDGVIIECLGKHEEELRVIATAAKGGQSTFYYSSIKKFMDDWEDAPEEPREWWYINECNEPEKVGFGFPIEDIESLREIGLLFDTEEETELAIRKLKAWKRLKDNGFKFTGFEETDRGCIGDFTIYCYTKPDYTRPYDDVEEDLDLLFGDEE